MSSQTVTWSGRDSDITVRAAQRAFIGGNTLSAFGVPVQTGGTFNASRRITIDGGADASGMGVLVHAASKLLVNGTVNADGSVRAAGDIDIRGVGDVDVQGVLLAGGRLEEIRENGSVVGNTIHLNDADSTISIRADRQLKIGRDLTAGKEINLVGGTDTRVAALDANNQLIDIEQRHYGKGLVLLGSAHITTTRDGSEINLSAASSVNLVASANFAAGLYALDAQGDGSVVNITSSGASNARIYIAGQVRAEHAIELNSGVSQSGRDIELDITGVLETVDGSIGFNAGVNGLIAGDIFARGDGSDVTITSGRSLTIEGRIEANDQVYLHGGDGTEIAGQDSLTLSSTAFVATDGGAGSITLSGTNDVIIAGAVGGVYEAGTAREILINSDLGTVLVDRTTGRVVTSGQLDITGRDLIIDGPVTSTYVASGVAAATPEVRLTADRDMLLRGNIDVSGDLSISAGDTVEIFDTVWDVSTLSINAGNIVFGSPVSGAPSAQLGAVIQAGSRIELDASNHVGVNAGVLLLTDEMASAINIDAATIMIAGEVHAGAQWANGSASAIADQATVSVSASNLLQLGAKLGMPGVTRDSGGNVR
ncbi:MAG: hypothetical protein Q7U14_03230, partial [Lacisediminimonas sp.]|nr:hypothetical protein [Lacisediminimonas sp.]